MKKDPEYIPSLRERKHCFELSWEWRTQSMLDLVKFVLEMQLI